MKRITLFGLAIAVGCQILLAGTTVEAVAQYQWTLMTKAAPFSRRDGAGALTFQGKMWLLGGWLSGSTTYNDVWTSTDGDVWTQVRPDTPQDPRMWEGRHCSGYVVFGSRMWIVGGDPNRRHYQPAVWSSSDGLNWTQATAEAPWGHRHLHYVVAHQGKIWVMGGQTLPQFVPGVGEAFYNDVWSSPDGANWTRVTEHAPWSPRGMIQGGVEFKGRMWLLGGGTYDTPAHPTRLFYNEVWSSADGRDWRREAVAPWAPRQYHSVAVFDGRMWIMAGGNLDTPGYNRNDVWYSADGVNWSELPHTPWPTRHAGSLFAFGDHLWMVAGSHPDSSPINDVWRLDKVRFKKNDSPEEK
jgi:hypothetical protein